MSNGAAAVENSMEVPQKTENTITIYSSKYTSGYLPKRTGNRVSERYVYTRAHSSIFHGSQKVENKPVSIDR